MTVTINGATVTIAYPVHSISVHKNRVAFEDAQGGKHAELNSAQQRRDFIDLLTHN
ncbi:hypothetical protein [Ferrimonas gelatinilytica]|uniref:Uncharacterized protein n=1 Tax=Ferrimonas gelatinilytica TaxID=1255257 RepID=A0ABP9RYJ5_9GAMM